ncbi:MAG: M20/M25/M40 family metallo-hydrolase [Erythrobacter sp.]|nr:M20/M25/M40 family metallo-hydrolase [Erythrobacter sp.]
MTQLGARTGLLIAALLAVAGCARAPLATAPPPVRAAIEASLMRDIEVLASDEYGGRRPGTLGEERTLAYITEELQKAGLVSGTNDPGSAWRAPVELIATEPASSRLAFRRGSNIVEIAEEKSAAYTSRRRALIEEAEMVFVGRLAEEVSEEDVTGRAVVMLAEPGVSQIRRRILFEKNPVAIITVVEDEAAIADTRNGFARERFLLAKDETQNLSAYTTMQTMSDVLRPEVWEDLLQQADTASFIPQPLDVTASIEATSIRREFTSYNVIGLLPGRLPQSGAVLLLAHWDHFGECGEEGAEDRICNGAVDNASGVALMLELARRLAASGPHDRAIYVLATSAEEAGLLGAKAFVAAPALPLDSIVAAFNFDTVAVAPEGSAVGFVGEGRTPLDSLIKDVLSEGQRDLGNPAFAESFVQRQDGWVLLEQGVPAVMVSTAFSSEIVLGPFLSSDYHRASDEIAKIELGGAVDDLLLHEELVKRAASTASLPSVGG